MSSPTIPKIWGRCLYRATMRNPRPRQHQLQITVRTDVEVEIYPETRQRWRARIPATNVRLDISGPSPEHVKSQVRELYEEQVTAWQTFDEVMGKPMPEPEPTRLPPTHIKCDDPLPQQIDARKNSVRAVCGKTVRPNQIFADQTIEQWLKARHSAGFLDSGAELITCGQCRLIIEKAQDQDQPQNRSREDTKL